MSKRKEQPLPDNHLPDFLQRLPVSETVRQRLAELGTTDPASLLGMLRASPTAFKQWLGASAAAKVAESLEAMVSPEDLETLNTPGDTFPTQGAVVDRPAPSSRPFVSALRERDQLYAALRHEQAAFAAPTGGRSQALEQQLEVLLQPPPVVVSAHPSPVGWLLSHLGVAPFRAAPERADELRILIEQQGITFNFVDDPETLASANLTTRRVHFGIAFAERVWAFSYAYLELLRLWQIYGPGSTLHLPDDVRAALEAVHRAEIQGGRLEWPKELPTPDPSEAPGTAGFAATELFLVIGAFALLHELGHILLGHRSDDPPARWIPREYEADDWAADWLLGRWREYGTGDDERVFIKRSLGGTVCIGHLAALESHRRTLNVTHPNPARRLLHYLNRNVFTSPGAKALPTEMSWMAAVLIVGTHMQAAGKGLGPTRTFADPREFLEEATRALS